MQSRTRSQTALVAAADAAARADALRYNFISCLILTAQNGFGQDVEPFLALCKETWGEEQLWAAVKDLPHGALALVDELCLVMGRTLYNLVVTLDLQAISLGGSVFWHHRDFLLPRLMPHMDGHLPSLTAGVQILPAGMQDKVGVYAALALVV
jgi:predicted NBD/HSP70 family sugar kinase